MAIDTNTNSLLRDLVLEVKAEEPKARQKANTVTSAIGTILTTVATVCTFILQSGLDLPQSTAIIVAVIGMVATDFAVSKTKNGMTTSVADRLELELARRIDLNHNHDDVIAEAVAPKKEFKRSDEAAVAELRAAAEGLASGPN